MASLVTFRELAPFVNATSRQGAISDRNAFVLFRTIGLAVLY